MKFCYKMNWDAKHSACSHRVSGVHVCVCYHCGTGDKGPSNDVKIKGLIYHKVSLNIAFTGYVYT